MKSLDIGTFGRGLINITEKVQQKITDIGLENGLCHCFIKHTSASLIITENADSDVLHDLESYMAKVVEDGADYFKHTLEGEDDMSAHIRSVLTGSSLTVPVIDGVLALGRWQGIFLWEHRFHAMNRQIIVTGVA
jgi:secondary thiamine-phosphate synthase enzyme